MNVFSSPECVRQLSDHMDLLLKKAPETSIKLGAQRRQYNIALWFFTLEFMLFSLFKIDPQNLVQGNLKQKHLCHLGTEWQIELLRL